MKSQVLQLINDRRIVAIVRLDDLSQAVAISCALARGGIAVQEFTLTNPDALKVVAHVKDALHQEGLDCAVGIGSVRNVDEARAALDAYADFIVSPITDARIIDACARADVAVMPGAYTPTEISTAWNAGADVVKVFPARGLSPGYIKDVLAPMPYLKLMPTGGVDLKNLASYFAAGAVAVGIGGNLIDAAAIASGNWDAVTAVAAEYAKAAGHA
ncbi:MAG: bifunctional 4-hydroxy-2-oxoglutarate aldolase/2-dehydro-3-deoxy-phosphogluconate aldolase, partial [Aureliella sp.]